VSSLEPCFNFVGFGKKDTRGRVAVELKCSLCDNANAKKIVFKGNDIANFTRHLKVC
jgi:hypothetical protein